MAYNSKEFFEAVNNGDSEAQYLLATYYENGTHGLTQNFEKAAEWYRQAADKGSIDAKLALTKLDERLKSNSKPRVNIQQSNSNSDEDFETKKIITSLSTVWIKIIIVSLILGVLIFFFAQQATELENFLREGYLRGIERAQKWFPILTGLIYLVVACFSIWIVNLFFKSLGEIISLLLDIKNLIENKR